MGKAPREEVELLSGSTAHDECVSLRDEVAEVSATLSAGVLASEVEEHGGSAGDGGADAATEGAHHRTASLLGSPSGDPAAYSRTARQVVS